MTGCLQHVKHILQINADTFVLNIKKLMFVGMICLGEGHIARREEGGWGSLFLCFLLLLVCDAKSSPDVRQGDRC